MLFSENIKPFICKNFKKTFVFENIKPYICKKNINNKNSKNGTD